jgi:hypothetical protein
MLMTLDVNDTINYLKYQFWLYGTNELKYNFTQAEFRVGSPFKPLTPGSQNLPLRFYVAKPFNNGTCKVVMPNT